MSDTINTNQNPEQQPTTPTPEASGGQGEKLFTQADVDPSVGDRLARHNRDQATHERETGLNARKPPLK